MPITSIDALAEMSRPDRGKLAVLEGAMTEHTSGVWVLARPKNPDSEASQVNLVGPLVRSSHYRISESFDWLERLC